MRAARCDSVAGVALSFALLAALAAETACIEDLPVTGADARGDPAEVKICDPPCAVGMTCNPTSRECVGFSRGPGCGNAAGLQAGAPYPMYRNCPTRSGASPFTGPKGNLVAPLAKSVFRISYPSFPNAIAADGTLYTHGSSDLFPQKIDAALINGDFIALRDSAIAWAADDVAPIGTPAIGVDGTLYFASADGKLHALSPEGKESWTFVIAGDPEVFTSHPVIGPDRTVYFTINKTLHAIAPTGVERWSFAPGGSLSDAAMSLDGTIVYVATTDRELHALRSDGSVLWSASVSGGVDNSVNCPAVGADGTVYVSAVGVFAFDPQGSLLWESHPSVAGGTCTTVTLSDAGSIYVVCDRKLLALDRNGEPQWTVPIPRSEDFFSDLPPTVAADGEIFQPAANQLLRLGPDGAIRSLWTLTVDSTTGVSTPVTVPVPLTSTGAIGIDHTLYVEGKDTYVHRLWTVGP